MNVTGINTSKSCLFFEVNSDRDPSFFTMNIVVAVLNVIFGFIAVFANALIMYVIWKNPVLHSPSNTLLCCLALADFLVGLLAQPAFVIHKIGEILDDFDIYCATRVIAEFVGVLTASVSILTLAAISVERLLAIRLHLRYKELVTTLRVLKLVALIWVFVILLLIARLVIANEKVFFSFSLPLVLASLLVTIVAYIFIFRVVLRHQSVIEAHSATPANHQTHNGRRQTLAFNFLKYKKSTLTMCYILGIFLLCYLPMVVVVLLRGIVQYSLAMKIAYFTSTTIVNLNSSINPVVYCWRVTNIRCAVKRTLSKMVGERWQGEFELTDFGNATKRSQGVGNNRDGQLATQTTSQ
ncbi:predicted protein [Nematostella vectensis]|uniref:G-protein coupled receptors family 1 profile domain-containing protein n=1 Tax=Nematostella vectensis TaxID=45351 RepID=A7RKZ2_NEMVE|nr:predicted protein [Nematostella vectensis]|eukprot:XP_001639831.1 predicted protein [Nematostella vectensis]